MPPLDEVEDGETALDPGGEARPTEPLTLEGGQETQRASVASPYGNAIPGPNFAPGNFSDRAPARELLSGQAEMPGYVTQETGQRRPGEKRGGGSSRDARHFREC